MKKAILLPLMLVGTLTVTGCATMQPVSPQEAAAKLQARQFAVQEDNAGSYLSPYTSDGVTAEWVEKSINAKLGSSVGGAAGAYAGQKLLEQVPFVGGILGQRMGQEAGRRIAIQSVGGEAFIRETSDLSFNDYNEMAGWLLVNHAKHPQFQAVMDATYQIYPELQTAYANVVSGRY